MSAYSGACSAGPAQLCPVGTPECPLFKIGGSNEKHRRGDGCSFNQILNTGTYQVEWPTSPLAVARTETPTYIEAWVMQGTTGASQRTREKVFGVPGRWIAVGIPPGWIQGRFEAWQALGIALAASHDSVTDTGGYFWWIDKIDLR
jgi:hypothetical protein